MEAKTLSEFKTREGVAAHRAEPYEDKELKVNGPALVLIITD